jgi:hypothetical protein
MKFKNIKKKAKKQKSPSNSRSITEQFKFSLPKINHATLFRIHRNMLTIFIVLIYIATLAVIVLDFKHYLPIKKNIESERAALTSDLNFWNNYISSHQNFADAYFQASVLEYELGDSSKAKIYVEKGLVLDPNSENGRKIENLLK